MVNIPESLKTKQVSTRVNKKLTVSLVGLSPGIVQKSIRMKGIPLAPLVLKAYADERLKSESLDNVDLAIKTFYLEETPVCDIVSEIISDKPDVVAFSVYIWNYREALECARIIRSINKDTVIVCGGPQVSPVAMEIMQEYRFIDIIPYVVIPGEIIFYKLIKTILTSKTWDEVEGIIYRTQDNCLVKTSELSEKLDYSTAPSAYLQGCLSLTPGESYTVVIETCRGCPMDCGYCFYGRGMRKIDYFPLERVLREIDMLYTNPDIKQVIYADADILLNKDRTEIIIKHILSKSTKVITEIDVNILNINEHIVKLLAKLPYHNFCFGVQTVNPKALKCIGKLRPEPEVFIEKFKQFKRWVPNSKFYIDIMLGLPGDDLAGFKLTIDTCLAFEATRLRPFYPVYLLPGTRFFEERKALGIRHGKTPPYCVIETETFPKKDIDKAMRLALWMEILTYYYPAIARYFYRNYAQGASGTRITTLERWIKASEEKFDLFGSLSSFVDTATDGSIQTWNDLKASLLRKASQAQSAYQIYAAIYQQEKALAGDLIEETIVLGREVFAYFCSEGIDSVEFKQFRRLPERITRGYQFEEIKNLFSRYSR